MQKLNLDLYDFPELYMSTPNMTKLASITGGESLLSKEELNLLPDSDFALIIKEGAATHRKFPIIDKPHAYASALIFGKTKQSLPVSVRNKVAANIAAAIQGGKPVSNIIAVNELNSLVKVAAMQGAKEKRASLADEDFALVITKDNTTRRLYPINTEDLCKTAAEYFEQNYVRIPIDFRYKFAKALTEKIENAKYNIKVSANLRKYYSKDFDPNLDAAIVARKALISDSKIKQAYELLQGNYKKTTPEHTALLLRKIDKLAGLSSSKYIKNAYASVFNNTEATTEKKANDVTIVGGYTFDPSTLQTLPYEKFQNLFSPSDYSELQASPVEGFNALPKIYQDQVASLAQG